MRLNALMLCCHQDATQGLKKRGFRQRRHTCQATNANYSWINSCIVFSTSILLLNILSIAAL
jgi:hypothetical protein